MPIHAPAVVVDDLSFSWPDGTPALEHVSCTFPAARTGLVGANGTGKSTLLRLIEGDLRPDSGAIHTHGRVGRLRQHLVADARATVADLLGISGVRAALRRIEAGSLDPGDYDLVGERWDVDARALAVLAQLGLSGDDDLLERPAATLSGGQATQVALAGVQLAGWDITLLDEPTNNLDARARARVHEAVEHWPGALVVVSHDRDLLERVDAIVDLDPARFQGGARSFGGTFALYRSWRDQQQEAAERHLREADAELSRARQAARSELERQQQRDRSGRRERSLGNVSKAGADYFTNRAQKNAASKSNLHSEAIERASAARAEADTAARIIEAIRIDLPRTGVPTGRQVLALEVNGVRLDLTGPERVRITGDNGSGKSTLLGWALGVLPSPADGSGYPVSVLGDARLVVPVGVPVGWLRQRTDELDGFETALDAVRDAAPDRTPHDARALLARFRLTGGVALQRPAALSGGERFRVALARVLFTDPAPQLLVLDEPTNNLDLDSVDQLVQALDGYRGALLVVTHDEHLARELQVHREWRVTATPHGVQVVDRLV